MCEASEQERKRRDEAAVRTDRQVSWMLAVKYSV